MPSLYVQLSLIGLLVFAAAGLGADRAVALHLRVDSHAVTTTDLNLRSGASTDFPVKRVIPAGHRVYVQAGPYNGHWYRVVYGGSVGYSHGAYLRQVVTRHGGFRTLPPGSPLPSGATCAARVRRHPWEPRPQNYAANLRTGRAIEWITGANSEGNRRFAPRVDGAFTGTTDEIIQWGACKWGLDEDVVRAIAVRESWWVQSHVGDNGDSFGLIQIRSTVHSHAYPMARTSTAFNVDYGLSWWRSCYEGYFDHWIPAEARGDQWGCSGLYYSGRWADTGGMKYASEVQAILASEPWLDWGYPGS